VGLKGKAKGSGVRACCAAAGGARCGLGKRPGRWGELGWRGELGRGSCWARRSGGLAWRERRWVGASWAVSAGWAVRSGRSLFFLQKLKIHDWRLKKIEKNTNKVPLDSSRKILQYKTKFGTSYKIYKIKI
jgi:hypothetical protein